jgi:glucose/mannose-6-phosphate isomerase
MPPRCAFGYSLFPLAFGLSKAGLFELDQVQLFEAVDIVEGLAQDCHWGAPADGNQAGRTAMHLHDSIPVIYASADRMGPAARRWANQVNENAKQPSYYALFPELCHNEIVGWDLPSGPGKVMSVVMLGDADDHPRNRIRARSVAGIIGDAARAVVDAEGKGQGFLARLLYLVHLGDWVSYYLAWLNKADPTPIPSIVRLKNILKESK